MENHPKINGFSPVNVNVNVNVTGIPNLASGLSWTRSGRGGDVYVYVYGSA
jgi:hypothetical protein